MRMNPSLERFCVWNVTADVERKDEEESLGKQKVARRQKSYGNRTVQLFRPVRSLPTPTWLFGWPKILYLHIATLLTFAVG